MEKEKPRGRRRQREITKLKIKVIREFYEQGYSYRQIARMMRMKNVNAVYYYIVKIREQYKEEGIEEPPVVLDDDNGTYNEE